MKISVKKIIMILSFCGCLIGNFTFAQDFVPLGRLAQEYLLRTTEGIEKIIDIEEVKEEAEIIEEKNTETVVQKLTEDVVVVNPEVVMKNAVTESIDTISKTTQEFEEEKRQIIEDVDRSVQRDIDESILKIRRQNNIPVEDLRRVIEPRRIQLNEDLRRSIKETTPVREEKIKEIRATVEESLKNMEKSLKDKAPDVDVNFDKSKRQIQERVNTFEERLREKKEKIRVREGALIYLDSDQDGISDYDEIYIYKTNPDNAFTIQGDINDGEKIRRGINPLSQNLEKKQYQDPREDRESFVSESYKVERVRLIKEKKKVALEGVALPNSMVTLYVFSTPIIVTVQTDLSGRWSYELEQELEDGEHQVYVTTVDATGKIVARSNPILFTKTAEAATLGIEGGFDATLNSKNFFRDNFILITLAILIVIIILAMMFVGERRNLKSVVKELKNEV